MISIEFSARSGNYLKEVLESTRLQTYQDFEVIVVNSNPNFSDLIKEYGGVEIPLNVGKLVARKLAHEKSRGEYELMLEETRILRPDALETLNQLDSPEIAVIAEEEFGDTFINRINRIDAMLGTEFTSLTPENLFVLPRFYSRNALDSAISAANRKLSNDVFSRIVGSDLEILYFEAYQHGRHISLVRDKLIIKYGESSVRESFAKYHRYGKTQRLLSGTCYRDFYNIKRRFRPVPSLKYLPALATIYAIRGTAFFAGYYLSR